MSAKYSVLVVIIVAALLMINSLWLSRSNTNLCPDCEKSTDINFR